MTPAMLDPYNEFLIFPQFLPSTPQRGISLISTSFQMGKPERKGNLGNGTKLRQENQKALRIHFLLTTALSTHPPANTLGSHSLNPSQVVFFVRLFITTTTTKKRKPESMFLKLIATDQTQALWLSPAHVCCPHLHPRLRWSQPSLASPSTHTISLWPAAMPTAPWAEGDRGLLRRQAGPRAKPRLCWARLAF